MVVEYKGRIISLRNVVYVRLDKLGSKHGSKVILHYGNAVGRLVLDFDTDVKGEEFQTECNFVMRRGIPQFDSDAVSVAYSGS